MRKILRSITLAAAVLGASSIAGAQVAVQYVKICSLYGVGFYYLPGTDVCLNVANADERQQTSAGTWLSTPSLPGTWVTSPLLECPLGRTIQLGPFTSASFRRNSHGKHETPIFPLALRNDEFISKIMIKGGFDVNRTSTFCLYFFETKKWTYWPLGCEDTADLKDQRAVFELSPVRTAPVPGFTKNLFLVGANGSDDWGPAGNSFNGSLTCWVCIQKPLPN